MKLHFWDTNKGQTTYTIGLLKYISVKYGHELNHLIFDILCVSLTSHYEILELKKARKKYPNSIIVVGGHASNAPLSLLRWADYVNLGQGFDFFKHIKSVSEINEKSYIISKTKLEGEYSHYIDWNILPVIQISKHSYSFLESIGCANKCTFCLTSWLNKYQKNTNENTLNNIASRF
jgi:radical SAM superfamily enzyme YgiQ (UPF0313 family)